MIEVANEYKASAYAPIKIAKVIVESDGVRISSDDKLVSVNIEASGNFFSCATKCCIFKVLNTSSSYLNKTLSVTLQLQDETSSWNSCKLGSFTITEQSIDLEKDTITIKGYDSIGIAGLTEYNPESLRYGESILNIFEQISAQLNISARLNSNNENLGQIIPTDPYSKINGITYRDILSEIAGATASIIRESDGDILLSQIEDIQEELTYDNLKKLKFGSKYGPINSIVLARTPTEDNVAVRDEDSIAEYGITEIKLANNELLDDNRESMAQPILDEIDGLEFFPFELTTEGHGWYEIGDRLMIRSDEYLWPILITNISLTIDGGIKEILKGIAFNGTQTNYSLSGGITKTIYNTEIKVDKQNQTIESIVEEQSHLENKVNENYSQITQNLTSIVSSVQSSGGNNLILNSAMYAQDDEGKPLHWQLQGTGDIAIAPSAEAAVNGSLSRQNISLRDMTISQVIDVKSDSSSSHNKTFYSFSCKIKKSLPGSCRINITDGTESGNWQIELSNGEDSFYNEYSIEGILPNSANLTLTIYASSDVEFSITDMMLSVGDYRSQWTQANGEFANTQVAIDSNGVTIRSNTLPGTYTKQTPQEISAYSNSQLVATINDDGLKAPKALFNNEINMPPIKIVPQIDGWAFVKGE